MLWCQGVQHIGLSNRKRNRMITIRARPTDKTDRQTDGRTSWHHAQKYWNR